MHGKQKCNKNLKKKKLKYKSVRMGGITRNDMLKPDCNIYVMLSVFYWKHFYSIIFR